MKEIDPKYLDILRRHDTPTVCNVIELLDVRPRSWGFMDGSIRALFPKFPPVVGYATTATFRSAHPVEQSDAYSNIVEQVRRFEDEVPRPRIVVFQDLDESPCGATFGEVMCTIYQSFGCVGLVTSGGARDLDQVERKGFACFASTVIPSHAYCRIVDIHVPVTVGGCAVRPGDLIHGDANGVTTIPVELAAEVALGCGKFVEAEQEVLGYLDRERAPDLESLSAAQKRMRKLQAEVVEAVRREL